MSLISPEKQYWIESELFEIPYNQDSIIYAPLKKAVFLANKNLVNLLCDLQEGIPVDIRENKVAIDKLSRLGIIHGSPESHKRQINNNADYDKPFFPINLTLFLTSDCNLACRYCYGNGGDRKVNMPIVMAKDAIDLPFLNADRSKVKQVHLSFHGGGEPVLRLRAMKILVEHARMLSRNRRVDLTMGLTSNGLMTTDAARWVTANIDQLNISFDGPKEIQNFQRPLKNGGDSYKKVARTLRILNSVQKKYTIRGTITNISQNRIPDIVTYITERFSPAGIHLEPMFTSPRAAKTKIKEPDEMAFVKGLLKGKDIAEKKGVRLYFSGNKFPKLSNTFCGIGWKNFAVTPDGFVTSCFEVLDKKDARKDQFFYGRYIANKGFL